MDSSHNTGNAATAAKEAAEYYQDGLEAFQRGDCRSALISLERAVAANRVPLYLSLMAFCLAKERREFPRAVSMCKEAIKHEPKASLHFLYLGRIHLLAGQKKDAIRIFRMGLRNEKNQDISRELHRLGSRKTPILPFLGRNNPLNKYLGIVLKKTGFRH